MEEKKEEFNVKDLHFEFDLSKSNYEIDVLQNRLLQVYLRADPKFRRAFSTNYTSDFFQFLKDKARLREPVHISVMGATRGGKSYTSISIATFLMACFGKIFTIDYICGNSVEFLEKLKKMPQEQLRDSCFLIDEEKTMYGYGSIAKKMNLQDVNSIIAINNISTINLNPLSWNQGKSSNYGIRLFGRCFSTFTTRSMLYDLQVGGRQSESPMGNLYIPIFTHFIPQPYASQLEKEYLSKKNEWVMEEQRGNSDVLSELRRKSAESFVRDKMFLKITKKKEQLSYIINKLGSSWTSKECEDILTLTSLLKQGFLEEEDKV